MESLLPYLPNFMLQPLFWVLAWLAVAIFLFLQNKLRLDVIALIILVGFALSGILTLEEVLAGFSNPNMLLLALLYVVGEALSRTGIAYQISEHLMRIAGANEAKIIMLLMFAITTIGSFMSSTGIVAIFIPVVVAICSSMNIAPRRLMMSLSMAGLISGMTTLIATVPNLVTHAELVKAGYAGFEFFDFAPIGFVVMIVAMLYMLIARNWLDNGEQTATSTNKEETMSNLIAEYHLNGRAKMVILTEHSPFIGKTIDQLKLRSAYHLNIIAIQRYKNFRNITLAAFGNDQLRKKDILLMDIDVDEARFTELCQEFKLQIIELKGEYFSTHAKSVGMAEFTVKPETETIGRTIDSLNFRSRYGLSVVGIKRDAQILQQELLKETVKSGDVLLVMGVWQKITVMAQNMKDLILLDMPKESKLAAPAASQAPYALFSVAVMVALMMSGVVPNVIAGFIGCLLLGAFRCIDMKTAYNAIHFPSIILIIGMMPFSIALQKTGGVAMMVQEFVALTGGANISIYWVLMGLFAATALVGLFISNGATAVLMAPFAIEVARQLGQSPSAFVMVVAIAASAAFMTPFSPVNTMVVALGNYRFSDFLKVGLPMTIMTMLITTFLVPVLFPL